MRTLMKLIVKDRDVAEIATWKKEKEPILEEEEESFKENKKDQERTLSSHPNGQRVLVRGG